MAEAEVGLRASLKDRRETAAGLKDLGRDVRAVGTEAETVGKRATIGARGLDLMRKSGKLAAFAAKAAFGGAIAVGYGLERVISSAVQGWIDHTRVVKLTQNVIKSTGGVANVTAKAIGKLSDALEWKTGVDGDVIQSGANMLLSFKNIRNEAGKGNDVFNQSLSTLVDFATFMHTDAPTAAVQLGKALNDPIKGLTALSKQGVSFDAQQTAQITTMTKAGNVMGAQKIILKELNSEFGGAAAAQRTWGDRVLVVWHRIQDTIGKAVYPLLKQASRWFVREGGPALEHYADVFQQKGVPAIRDFLDQARPLARKWLPQVGNVLGTVRDAVKDAAPYVGDLVKGFNNLPGWVKEGIAGGGLTIFAAKKTGATSVLGGLKSLLGTQSGGLGSLLTSKTPVPVFVTNPDLIPGGPGGKGGPGIVAKTAATAAEGAETAAQLGGKALTGVLAPVERAAGVFGRFARLGTFLAPPAWVSAGDSGAEVMPPPVKGPIGNAADLSTYVSSRAVRQSADLKALLTEPLNAANLSGKQFGGTLDKIGRTKVSPPVTTPGLPKAQSGLDWFNGTLRTTDKGANARVTADTKAANAGINGVRNNLDNLHDKVIRVTTVTVGGHTASTVEPHANIEARAGGGRVYPGRDYLVGEHRAEVVRFDRPGTVFPRVDMPLPPDYSDMTPTRPIQIQNTVLLDGKVVYDSVLTHAQDRDARR